MENVGTEALEMLEAALDRERGVVPAAVEERRAEWAAAWEEKRLVLSRQKVPEPSLGFVAGLLAAGETCLHVRALMETAWAIEAHVLEVLSRRGPVGADHSAVIEHLSVAMASMLLEPEAMLEVLKVAPQELHLFLETGRMRVAFALAVGLGKTLTTTALAIAIVKALDLDPYLRDPMSRGLLYTTSNIRLLCDFRQALLDGGVPEDRIGLVYSDSVKDCPVPSIKNAHVGHYPILLATQAMVSAATARDHLPEAVTGDKLRVDELITYRGRERLTVWDEAFSAALAEGASRFQLALAESMLQGEAFRQEVLRTGDQRLTAEDLEALSVGMTELVTGIDRAAEEVAAAMKGKGSREVRTVTIPDELSERSIQLRDLGYVIKNSNNGSLGDTLISVSAMASAGGVEISVLGEPGDGRKSDEHLHLLRARVVVANRIKRLLILDANFEASVLARMEPTVKLATSSAWLGRELEPVRYDKVSLRFYASNAGRGAMTGKGLDNTRIRRRLIKEQVERAVLTPPDERCLFITFNQKEDQRGPDFVGEIQEALKKQCTGGPQTVMVNGQLKPRFEVLTWGAHEGLNDYSDCTHLFFVGVMFRPWLSDSTDSSLRNALFIRCSDDHGAFGGVGPEDLVMNQVFCALRQALGRGSMRAVVDGQASRMVAHIPVKELSKPWTGKAPCKGSPLWEQMSQWLPGVQMESASVAPPPTNLQLVQEAADYIWASQPAEVTSMSTKVLVGKIDEILSQAGITASKETKAEAFRILTRRSEELHRRGAECWVRPSPTARSWVRSSELKRQQEQQPA